VPHVPLRGAWFGCDFSRGCSFGSKAGLTPPWWQVKPPLAPGGLRGTPISQCPGTTGYNENKALPFPRHGNAPPAARRGASRVWPPKWGVVGPCFTPTPTPHRPRRLKQTDPPQYPRVQYYCTRGQPDAPPGRPRGLGCLTRPR
jgi:hypothetical protein